MVTIDLITGFLGSGKTTFLKKYAEYLMDQGLHIGILENDFGAINVDMLMLHELRGDQCELEMIAGGCDAESHRRRFRTKLISMRMCGYDRVLVEPSGIYDVDEFFDVLREETEATEAETVQTGPEVVEWNSDSQIYWTILEADPEQIRFKSRLLTMLKK